MTIYESSIKEKIIKKKDIEDGHVVTKTTTDKENFKVVNKSKDDSTTPKEIRLTPEEMQAKKDKKRKNKSAESYQFLYHSSLRLDEGKSQAIAILKKGISDLPEDALKDIIETLTSFDPTTPKNKYLEFYAKIYIKAYNENRKHFEDIPVIRLLNSFNDFIKNHSMMTKISDIENRKLKIDLNKINTLSDFDKELTKLVQTLTKSIKKKGISGLKQGVDYFDFKGQIKTIFSQEYQGYIPLSYEASKVIASNRVGECEGEWCTAWQKSNEHWRRIVKKDKDLFIYAVRIETGEKQSSNNAKLALQFNESGKLWNVWNAQDQPIQPTDLFGKIGVVQIESEFKKIMPKVKEIIFADTDNTQLFEYMKTQFKLSLETYRVNKGEVSTVEGDTWKIKTNGWTNDTTVHDFLDSSLVELLDNDDIGEAFRHDYWEKRSSTEIVHYIQDYVKDPKAKKEVEATFPRLFDVSGKNYEEFEEWESGLEHELKDLNRIINIASKQAYMDNGVESLISLAKGKLEEAFMVTVKNWDEIILELPLQSLYDHLDTSEMEDEDEVDEMLNDFEIWEYLKEEYEDMFKYNDRYDLDNIYGDASDKVGTEKYNYLEMAINEYGIED